jgi:hypothetical protein
MLNCSEEHFKRLTGGMYDNVCMYSRVRGCIRLYDTYLLQEISFIHIIKIHILYVLCQCINLICNKVHS